MSAHRTPKAKHSAGHTINASQHTPHSVSTAAVSASSTPVTPSAAASSSSSNDPPKILSGRVLGMKFMQRASESTIRAKLETELTKTQQEQRWTSTPNASPNAAAVAASAAIRSANIPAVVEAAASPSSSPFASSSAFSSSPFPTATLPSSRSSVFLIEDEVDILPIASADPSQPATAPSRSSALPFIPGRRSYGSFNPHVDTLVSQVREQEENVRKGVKADAKHARQSVDDESMTDHYVGLRGKAMQHQQSKKEGNANGNSSNHQKRSHSHKQHKQGGGGGNGAAGKKHHLTHANESNDRPTKKQKGSNKK